ncbi:MAG: heme-binding Shp domain-containing protein [Clostridia bacterium]
MKKFLSVLLAVFTAVIIPINSLQVLASETSTIEITGHYQNPNTGIIEDSGGESSMALGQSMVENMMSSSAVLEENDGTYDLTFDFNLYNYISDIEFQFQNKGESTYNDLSSEVIEEQEETVTLKVTVDTLDGLLRASCYVIPMGRSVVFYITYSDVFDDVTVDTDTSVSTDTLVDDYTETNTSTSTNSDVLGLTLSSGLTSADESDSGDSGNIEVILDDSFWVILFVLVICANILTGSLLIFAYHMIKTRLLNKKEEVFEEETEENKEFIDISSFDLEVDDENA